MSLGSPNDSVSPARAMSFHICGLITFALINGRVSGFKLQAQALGSVVQLSNTLRRSPEALSVRRQFFVGGNLYTDTGRIMRRPTMLLQPSQDDKTVSISNTASSGVGCYSVLIYSHDYGSDNKTSVQFIMSASLIIRYQDKIS